MEMRLIVVCGLLLSALWVGESRCSDDDEFYDARLVTNARLVFAAELADLTQSAGNGPKHAPSDRMAQRIDTVAAGSGAEVSPPFRATMPCEIKAIACGAT